MDNRISIREVDERDSRWEAHGPLFRVYLHNSGEHETSGATATYDVTGADILQVIDWAQEQVHGHDTYAVALVVDDAGQEAVNPGGGRGLVWLVGTDGNNSYPHDPVPDDHRRMLARRAHPVGIPPEDHMPPINGQDFTLPD